MTPDQDLLTLRNSVDLYLKGLANENEPESLYEPIRYVLHAPGKRIRPILSLISGKMAGGHDSVIMPVAAAVEVFHNFTLVHDDIMDHAASRRGNPTVHVKWDENVAILSGDMMVGMAYRLLLFSETEHLRDVISVFQDSVDAVCEGQALDKEFETRPVVSIPEYLTMIEKKTAWLISTALRIGWVAVNGKDGTDKKLHNLAILLGRGFQIQDDYLDLMGDQASFGKSIGGDIVEGKKTYLLLTALERAEGDDKLFVRKIMNREVGFDQVPAVRDMFKRLGVLAETETVINQTFEDTYSLLKDFEGNPAYEVLKLQIEQILNRKF